MINDLIQWPRAKYWDRAWNPIIGCRPCSPACDNCYARAWAARFGQSFEPHPSKKLIPPSSGVVFCGNMTDLFGDWVRIHAQYEWFSSLWNHPRPHGGPVPNDATYLFLTKRVTNMVRALEGYTDMPHCFFGFTAENQEWYDKRIHVLTHSPAVWRDTWWLSAEPLLGHVDLNLLQNCCPFNWVVVGCESGPRRRPCEIEWVEGIVDQCRSAGVPVFVKQLDIGGRCVTDINRFPEHLRIRQVPWAPRAAE